MSDTVDAVVVGSGPNGLAAAIALAREGMEVVVFEGAETIGGSLRSAELTRPGFIHDVCSSVFPLGAASPFFGTLDLERHGVRWVHPDVPLAHPFDSEPPAELKRSVDATAEGLGADAAAYRRLLAPLADDWDRLGPDILGPLSVPRHPVAMARFGLRGLRPACRLASDRFAGGRARGLLAGNAAHSFLPLDRMGTSAFGLVLMAAGHAVGWPFVEGGSGRLAHALSSCLRELGGTIVSGRRIRRLAELPPARAVLCDVTPRQFLELAGDALPSRYRRALERYRYGPSAYKVDWALHEPIPWRDRECARAGTVHIGGGMEEIARAERDAWQGRPAERPFVLLAQPSVFDSSRAPEGKHTAWAYCHVPHGSGASMVQRVEAQVERFAPGFRDTVLDRSVMSPALLERHNPNLVGGDINGGSAELRQLFFRPTLRWQYRTPLPGVFLCSAATPPGGGVHGMCGYHAARAALRELRRGRRA